MDGVERMYLKHQITAFKRGRLVTNTMLPIITDSVDSSTTASWLEQKVWLLYHHL